MRAGGGNGAMVAPTALPTQNPKTRLKREPRRREARPPFGALYANHDNKTSVITFCKAAGGRFDSDGATITQQPNPKYYDN